MLYNRVSFFGKMKKKLFKFCVCQKTIVFWQTTLSFKFISQSNSSIDQIDPTDGENLMNKNTYSSF